MNVTSSTADQPGVSDKPTKQCTAAYGMMPFMKWTCAHCGGECRALDASMIERTYRHGQKIQVSCPLCGSPVAVYRPRIIDKKKHLVVVK